MKSPLTTVILNLLKNNLKGISEYEILQTLKEKVPEFNNLAKDETLQLFRQHFLIMNALYQLQNSLWIDEKVILSIHVLEIKLLDTKQLTLSNSKGLGSHVDAKLAAYYLDWSEYEKTDHCDVTNLINSFYKRMDLEYNKQSALDILGIESKSPTEGEIKKQYRKLVRIHHPDTGGNPEIFIEIRQAYEQLLM
jgi:hypothetical protein